MIRLIYKQIWNRRRSNGWLLIELFLVFFLLWYMVDFFFTLGYSFSQKNYRDLDHTWEIKISELPQEHPEYKPAANEPEMRYENFKRILELLKQSPLIETVGISYSGAAPGKGSMQGSSLVSPVDSQMVFAQWVPIDPDYNFMEVFRISKNKGKEHVRTADFNWTTPNGIVTNKLMEDLLMRGESLIGVSTSPPGAPAEEKYTIIGVVDNTKRFDSGLPQGVVYKNQKLDSHNLSYAEVVVRSKSSVSDKSFKETFLQETAPALRVGNFYFHNMLYFPKIQADTEKAFGLNSLVQTQAYLMVFFMLNLILCLIGTFWYRVYVRREEIGIRIALGSDKKNIMNLFRLEIICLLSLILVPVMLLEYQIVHLDLLLTYGDGNNQVSYLIFKPFLRFLITNTITFVLMACICLLAVWLPARKATTLEPAEALRDE